MRALAFIVWTSALTADIAHANEVVGTDHDFPGVATAFDINVADVGKDRVAGFSSIASLDIPKITRLQINPDSLVSQKLANSAAPVTAELAIVPNGVGVFPPSNSPISPIDNGYNFSSSGADFESSSMFVTVTAMGQNVFC